MRLWFRVVAPHRAALAEAPRETRLHYWRRHRSSLEAQSWEELCRMAVPMLHRADIALARLGPFEPARRYWHGNRPELDVVALSVDGGRLLVGEAKWRMKADAGWKPALPARIDALPGAANVEAVRTLFVPDATAGTAAEIDAASVNVVDARTVLEVLR